METHLCYTVHMIDDESKLPVDTAFTDYADLLGSNPEVDDARNIPYRELPAPSELEVGDVIEGLANRGAFNTFEVIAVEHIQDVDDGSGFVPEGLWVPDKSLDIVMTPPKYSGEITGGVAVVNTASPNSYHFTVVAELSSTGRGVLGYTVREVTYKFGNSRKAYPVIRKLGKDKGLLASDALSRALLEEARFSDIEAKRAGIANAVLGGLPSLGKRRS